ncbi:hypothetical protein L484_013785 [Morus notabilis]|uniref:Uncharacterized protein n=1 Tax=Morus notabilis TaxID=981085 RepID=W9R433_9ROSA|nr:hypothetical protein L484_013785 [Morus notabilis]
MAVVSGANAAKALPPPPPTSETESKTITFLMLPTKRIDERHQQQQQQQPLPLRARPMANSCPISHSGVLLRRPGDSPRNGNALCCSKAVTHSVKRFQRIFFPKFDEDGRGDAKYWFFFLRVHGGRRVEEVLRG